MKKMISANRMELMRLKKELQVARRGHKMLKDKRDELMRQFLDLVKENLRLRKRVNQKLERAEQGLSMASAVMETQVLQNALLVSTQESLVDVQVERRMGVEVPRFRYTAPQVTQEHVPYSLALTSEELDYSVKDLNEAIEPMLALAELEKTVQLLADEIEKTRRRVNSLEYVKIPELQEQIRVIKLRMDENERGNLTRLMKVKDIILEREYNKKHQEN